MTPAAQARIRQALDALGDALTAALADERANSAPDRLLSIAETSEALGIGRSKVYAELGAGRLRSLRIGDRRLVPQGAIRQYVELASGNGKAPAEISTPAEAMEVSGAYSRRRPATG